MNVVLDLSGGALAFLVGTVFLAGIVRGFTGFAASATVIALATFILPPIDLLPLCLLLEILASVFLMRGGIADADHKLVLPMVGFAFAALPLGLFLTKVMDPDLSRLVALGLVAGLASLQLVRFPLPVGRGPVWAVSVGALAGLVQGLAAVGGLVQALYVMMLRMPPRTMRATMILGVMFSGAIGFFWQIAMGVMTVQALARFAAVVAPFALGLWLGRRNFTPENERFYRPVSLLVLIGVAGMGIVRQLL